MGKYSKSLLELLSLQVRVRCEFFESINFYFILVFEIVLLELQQFVCMS